MGRKAQHYSKEFKAEAVRTIIDNQLSSNEAMKELPDYLFLGQLNVNRSPYVTIRQELVT